MIRLWRWLIGEHDPSWTTRVQSFKTDTPLALPPIKPLKAVKAKARKKARISVFRRGHS